MKTKEIIRIGVITLLSFVIYTSCTKRNYEKIHPPVIAGANSPAVCDSSGAISYSLQVSKALSNNCSIPACHSSTSLGGGVDLSNYNGVFNCASSGKLLSCVVWDGNASAMPKNAASKILDCDIAKIRNWIYAGAPNN